MKSSFLKYLFFPVLFLLVFQGEGRGEVFSGFGKEEQVLTAAKNHVNNLPSTGLGLVKLTDAKAFASQTSALPPSKMVELIKGYSEGPDFVGDMNSIQGFYVKAAIDARSAGKMDDVATFYAAVEKVRMYRKLEPLKDHIDDVSDLWQDVEKLDLFISDLSSNENLLDFFKAVDDATRLKYAGAWENLVDAGAFVMKTDVAWINKVDNWTAMGFPKNQINKALSEIASNNSLKAAFEADEIVFGAWKWIDDGIPTLPQGQPSTYLNYLKKKTIYLNQSTEGGGAVKYYRVQQSGTNGPKEILFLDNNGNVTFGASSNDWLNFSTDDIEHARYFKDLDPTNRYIIEFEMPKSFDDALKQDAIPQWGASNNANYWEGLTPQIADPNQPGHPFTTRQWDAYWKSEFQLNVIPGSGQIVQ